MPFMRYGDAIDDVVWIALCDRAVVMTFDRTTADIANAGNRDAADRKMMCADAFNLTSVRSRVAETDHIAHRSPFFV